VPTAPLLPQFLTVLLLTCVLISPEISAQSSPSSYRQADQLQARTRNKVFRDQVRPHWFGQGSRFWYQVSVGPDRHRFVLVDADSGTRGDAFPSPLLTPAVTGSVTWSRTRSRNRTPLSKQKRARSILCRSREPHNAMAVKPASCS